MCFSIDSGQSNLSCGPSPVCLEASLGLLRLRLNERTSLAYLRAVLPSFDSIRPLGVRSRIARVVHQFDTILCRKFWYPRMLDASITRLNPSNDMGPL